MSTALGINNFINSVIYIKSIQLLLTIRPITIFNKRNSRNTSDKTKSTRIQITIPTRSFKTQNYILFDRNTHDRESLLFVNAIRSGRVVFNSQVIQPRIAKIFFSSFAHSRIYYFQRALFGNSSKSAQH